MKLKNLNVFETFMFRGNKYKFEGFRVFVSGETTVQTAAKARNVETGKLAYLDINTMADMSKLIWIEMRAARMKAQAQRYLKEGKIDREDYGHYLLELRWWIDECRERFAKGLQRAPTPTICAWTTRRER